MDKLLKKMNTIVTEGETIMKSGIKGFSTIKLFSLLGYRQQIQLKSRSKNNIYLACWALSKLGKKELEEHEAFMERFFFINFKGGEVPDLTLLKEALDKSERQLSLIIKKAVISVLYENQAIKALKLTAPQTMQVKSACKKILIDLNSDKRLAKKEALERLEPRLNLLNLNSFVSLITVSLSFFDDKRISDSAIATVNIVSHLNDNDLLQLEEIFDTILCSTQSFCRKYHTTMLNTAKLFDIDDAWVKFFDGNTVVSPPSLLDLVAFYSKFDLFSSKPIEELNKLAKDKQLKKRTVKQDFLRPMKKFEGLIDSGKTIDEVFLLHGGKGVAKRDFIKSYEHWKKIGDPVPFWRK